VREKMTRFYEVREDKASRHTGDIRAVHQWGLPGVRCPTCGATWAGGCDAYPSVDLSGLANRHEYEEARPEPFDEFARLRELVQPLIPPGLPLEPGIRFGPLVGTATGSFGPFFFQNPWTLLVRPEVLARLQAEGVRGLKGCRTQLRFRQKNPPELLELEIPPHGRLHPDCTPRDRPPPCPKCGRDAFRLPDDFILEAATLPTHTDLFRLTDFTTILICTQSFADAVRRLELDEIVFREVPIR
jgi:uncharacterized double-CXXCG motif protein